MAIRVGLVVPGHPEDPLHRVEAHPPHVHVSDERSSPHRGFDPHPGLGVVRGDVLRPDVFDPAGHLAPERDRGAVRGDAGEAADYEVFCRHPEGDPVLVPSAFHGDAVVAGDYVAVFDPGVRARVWVDSVGVRRFHRGDDRDAFHDDVAAT